MKEYYGEAIEARIFRVFVSSTFSDMQGERDELVKFVFPQLRKLCEKRAVGWGEVDLRWGITDEQKAEGKVLPICLEEIEKCRPYFIGILGERYGSLPDEIPPDLLRQHPWLAEHVNHSVTELEILHGVLRSPEMAGHAFFYFRSPDYLAQIPESRRHLFQETATEQEVARFGQQKAEKGAEARRNKLDALKQRIVQSGLPVRVYNDPKALGPLVLRDLTNVIEVLYPAESKPDALTRENYEHYTFALSRFKSYVADPACFDKLDQHFHGTAPPLTILGESGLGKSALLANWAIEFRKKSAGSFLLMHFVGATATSTDWVAMLRRIMQALKHRFKIERAIPDEPGKLRQAFQEFLLLAGQKERFGIIIDALNQLEDRDGAHDLVWLPESIPASVRMYLSTLPGRSLNALRRRNWPTLSLQPLDRNQRLEVIARYLSPYRKELDSRLKDQIADAPQTGNALYLRALLEELRIYGDHYTLNRQLKDYLDAPAVDDLFEKILARYERDYQLDRPDLVRDSMSLIACSRNGLTETELLDLVGSNQAPLPHAYWAPLFLAAESGLINRSGKLAFFHDSLRRAVTRKYLEKKDTRANYHLQLAEYFLQREGSRKLEESPWQLAQAESWNRLHRLLVDLTFLTSLWEHNSQDVKRYWAALEEKSTHRLNISYNHVFSEPAYRSPIWILSSLFDEFGYKKEALEIGDFLIGYYRNLKERPDLAEVVERVAEQEGLDEKQKRVRVQEMERFLEGNLGVSLVKKARIRLDQGHFEEALTLFSQAEEIFVRLEDKQRLCGVLSGQAHVFYTQGNLNRAIELWKSEEIYLRELADLAGLESCLGNQAKVFIGRNDFAQATELLRQEEQLCRELDDSEHLAACLGSQAEVLQLQKKYREALPLYEEAEKIAREFGNKEGLQSTLGNRARVFMALGQVEKALTLLEEQEGLVRSLGDPKGLASCLYGQGVILGKRRATRDLALSKGEEALRIYRDLDMPVEAKHSELLVRYIRSGISPHLAVIALRALLILIMAGGVFLGLWNPWLWIAGVPMIVIPILSFLASTRWMQRIIRQWSAEFKEEDQKYSPHNK